MASESASKNARQSFGFASRKRLEAVMTSADARPPRVWYEVAIVLTPGIFPPVAEKGGGGKGGLPPPVPLVRARRASGCDKPMVSGSSLAYWSSPHSLAAAICNTIACVETLTDGTAILSFPVKSLIDFTSGLRVTRYSGYVVIAEMPLTPPLVLSQSVISEGAPVAANCTLPEMSPSLMTLGPASFVQVTRTPGRPADVACFSTSLSRSISMSGKKLTPYCCATWTSLTSPSAGRLEARRTLATRNLVIATSVGVDDVFAI